ncbi:MAG: PCRF domain-containing protein [Gallionella sp.]|jgi:peptide chain release factor 1|nr:PCRF domain-containing protein [Gallionella sp.]MDH2904566.1 peptide chain release factor-like protein [Actinomycetota bacterium]
MQPSQNIEIRPGEGGDDAAHFASELVEALRAYITNHGVPVVVTEGRTIVLALYGHADHLNLTRFTGTHRIQRIPNNDRNGRRHTSTATVALIDDPGTSQVELIDDELRCDFYRGHGKGGQHRNKTSSAVRLTHLPTGTVVVVERGRSQAKNLEAARAELLRRLTDERKSESSSKVNQTRTRQISTGERPTKQWTWNAQRDEVLHHETGRRYRMAAFLRGELDG